MKKNNQLLSNAVQEPTTLYKKTISTSSSFKEMNETEAKAMANISAINHLQNATSLIKKVYAAELKKTMNKKIIFK